jgi:FtsP/CotA-like multicopper oxidase with cupredoxin domain
MSQAETHLRQITDQLNVSPERFAGRREFLRRATFAFGDQVPTIRKPDLTISLVFTSRFKGHGALDQSMINGKSYPDSAPLLLHEGLRHRLGFDNRSMDDHPIHLHRHSFELVSIRGAALSGVHKDVVIVEAGTKVEADLLATNPGNTLFHCHQQDHMDAGFMALFRYA